MRQTRSAPLFSEPSVVNVPLSQSAFRAEPLVLPVHLLLQCARSFESALPLAHYVPLESPDC